MNAFVWENPGQRVNFEGSLLRDNLRRRHFSGFKPLCKRSAATDAVPAVALHRCAHQAGQGGYVSQ